MQSMWSEEMSIRFDNLRLGKDGKSLCALVDMGQLRGNLFIQPDGPGTKALFLGCHDIDGMDEPIGDYTTCDMGTTVKVRCEFCNAWNPAEWLVCGNGDKQTWGCGATLPPPAPEPVLEKTETRTATWKITKQYTIPDILRNDATFTDKKAREMHKAMGAAIDRRIMNLFRRNR